MFSSFVVILLAVTAASYGLGWLDAALRGALLGPVPQAVGGMLELNVTLVIQAVSYLVFWLALDRVLFRPILAHLDRRREAVTEAESAADAAERAVREAQRARQERLDEAFREAAKEKAEIKAAGVAEYQEQIRAARQGADARFAEAQAEIAREVEAAEGALADEVTGLAAAMRGKLLRQEAN